MIARDNGWRYRAVEISTKIVIIVMVYGMTSKGIDMFQLNLGRDELAVLQDVLENDLSDLRMEIAGTENMRFRDQLKRREEVLRKVIDSLLHLDSAFPGSSRVAL